MRPYLLCLLLLPCTCVSAQTSLSISDAIQEGLANNYQIRLTQADLNAAENNIDDALTGKRPTINLGLSPGISYRKNTNPASIVAQSSTFSYGIGPTASLNWTLFNGGGIAINRERFETIATLGKEQLQIQVENTVADLVDAYYNAVVTQEQIAVLQRILNLSRDRIDYEKVRAEFGQSGVFDELQARDSYLSDSSQLVNQQLQYDLAIRNLLQLMGSDDLNLKVRLTTELDEVTEDYDRAALESQLLASNSQLASLRVSKTLANIETRAIEALKKPTVNFTAGASYDYNLATGNQTFVFGDAAPDERPLPGIGATTLAANVGISASYLLYDGGARNVRVQTAKLQEITANLNVDAVAQQLRFALASALDSYENQLEIINITRRQIDNAEQNLAIAEERFKGGTINSFDYRVIQVNYINAEFQLFNVLLALKNTETEVLRLTGGIVD